MKVKWNGQTVDAINIAKKPRKEFWCRWNDYEINIFREVWKKRSFETVKYVAYCYAPNGGLIVDGSSSETMRDALQECFDNIGFPLIEIGED